MRIYHNLAALNAYRHWVDATRALRQSTAKLSSGRRIGRAADDAAGLAISEKLQGQIRGTWQASRNAQGAISLLQTAEGALNESHAVLQRMRGLALQAANGTYTPADRWQIQQEVNRLVEELSRIAGTTEFNATKLLGGTFQGVFQVGAILARAFRWKLREWEQANWESSIQQHRQSWTAAAPT